MYKKYLVGVISAFLIISNIGCSSSDTDQPEKSTDATASASDTTTVVITASGTPGYEYIKGA